MHTISHKARSACLRMSIMKFRKSRFVKISF